MFSEASGIDEPLSNLHDGADRGRGMGDQRLIQGWLEDPLHEHADHFANEDISPINLSGLLLRASTRSDVGPSVVPQDPTAETPKRLFDIVEARLQLLQFVRVNGRFSSSEPSPLKLVVFLISAHRSGAA